MFDMELFLNREGQGRRTLELEADDVFFQQGAPAAAVYYLARGRAKLSVVSPGGKGAVLRLLGTGEFAGEEAMASWPALRLATGSALTPCRLIRIERATMLRMMQEEPEFSRVVVAWLAARSLRLQESQVDMLFNNSERRLARVLLMMAEVEKPDEAGTLIPPITQETLADMVGTTRSRVSYFMNRFRKHGLIEYRGRIRVHPMRLDEMLTSAEMQRARGNGMKEGSWSGRLDSN